MSMAVYEGCVNIVQALPHHTHTDVSPPLRSSSTPLPRPRPRLSGSVSSQSSTDSDLGHQSPQLSYGRHDSILEEEEDIYTDNQSPESSITDTHNPATVYESVTSGLDSSSNNFQDMNSRINDGTAISFGFVPVSERSHASHKAGQVTSHVTVSPVADASPVNAVGGVARENKVRSSHYQECETSKVEFER